MSAAPEAASARLAALARWLPATIAAAWLARATIGAVLAKTGHAAVPLDDAYIHFQYARRLAEGHFFSFTEGEGYTSGATSLLWPAALAPFWALGLREESLAWAAWGLSFAALAALAVETQRLATKLVGAGPALGASAMVLTFGGHVWCAASGMEVVPLALVLARTGRLAADWAEAAPEARTSRRLGEMLALGALAPLVRPEGAIASAIAAAAALFFARGAPRSKARLAGRASAAIALAGPLVPPLLNLALTGHAASATTIVKWLPLSPYQAAAGALEASVRENVRLFFDVLLDGREWSAIFVPTGSRPFAIAALAAIPAVTLRTRKWARGAIVLALALGMLVPCTYTSFLWNRLRYLWPFAFAWAIGLASLARLVGELAALASPRFIGLGSVVAGLFAGGFASHLSWTIDDVAGSASAIDRQQVTLGKWASTNLPKDARVGVNDTGAIGYFAGRRTFDVVGLTTPAEARYWVAGTGSRYEHYERLRATSPAMLPTHFIVYPSWMGCEVLLGAELTRATVTDQTILGGTTMVAAPARWDVLGAADLPAEPPAGDLVDELDVADLESEAAHGYALGRSSELDDVVLEAVTEDDEPLADGARVKRSSDEFSLAIPARRASTLVVRFSSPEGATVDVLTDGRLEGSFEAPKTDWEQASVALSASPRGATTRVRLVARGEGKLGPAHYWLYASR